MAIVINKGDRPKSCGGCKYPKTRCTCGRPSVITPQKLHKLETAFRYAFTDTEACAYAGISTSSLYRYCEKNPRFREQKEGLKLWPFIHAKMHICNSIYQGNLPLSRWWLERKDPEFSRRRGQRNDVEATTITGLAAAAERWDKKN